MMKFDKKINKIKKTYYVKPETIKNYIFMK